jgi:hypothetical protein
MSQGQRLAGILAVVLLGLCVRAGAEEPPWRPIPSIPQLLWTYGFDEAPKGLIDPGTLATGEPTAEPKAGQKSELKTEGSNVPLPPGEKCGKMSKGGDKREMKLSVHLDKTPLRCPASYDPNTIHFQFALWTDEPGTVHCVFKNSSAWYEETWRAPKVKQWNTLVTKFSSMSGDKGARIKATFQPNEIEFKFNPTHTTADNLPTFYLDNFYLTQGLLPSQVEMAILARKTKMDKLAKTTEKDGFVYTGDVHDGMKLALFEGRPARRAATPILVAAPAAKEVLQIWTDAGKTAKLSAAVAAAKDPRDVPLAGLADLRAFLPGLMAKSNAQAIVLVVGQADATGAGKPEESLRIVLQRLLAAKRLPLVCLPPVPKEGDGEKKRIEDFRKAAIAMCAGLKLPYVDQGFAFQKVAKPYAGSALTPEGAQALAGVALPALKHIQECLTEQ